MRRFGLTLLSGAIAAGLVASLVFAQALPGQSNGRVNRSGKSKPGGASPQVQYDNNGVFGGITNVISDGTHQVCLAETTPAAPLVGSVAYDSNNLLFPAPMRIDSFFGVPAPNGFFRGQAGISQVGTAANWYSCFNFPGQWNSTSFDVAIGCGTGIASVEGSPVSGGGWATDFTHRIRRVGMSTIAGQVWVGMHRGNLDDGQWTGNSPGTGGFVFWSRIFGAQHEIGDETFSGVAAISGAFVGGSRPGQQLNTAYIGCDASDTNLQACSNDSTTTSCVDLGVNFPCRTTGAIYDTWIAYPPNSLLQDAGTGFNYYVERLDTPATVNGTKSGNLPSNAVQMTPHVVMHSPDGGSLTTKIEISGVGTWSLW